jgi:ATP-dependent helicase/nuclease subunit B
MAGLNEGVWPPQASHDPWLSRSMKKDFGLPLPERNITLSAHDFTQGFCSSEVFLTRSNKIDGSPTIAARWLERLDTFLQAINISPENIKGKDHLSYIQKMEAVDDVIPLERPAPRPPVSARPRSLSVTRIEKWLNDPYAIYAEKILKLSPLDMLEKPIDYAEKGTILHEILYQFIDTNRQKLPQEAKLEFIETAKEIFKKHSFEETEWQEILPRLHQMAEWFIDNEENWRKISATNKLEVKGSMLIETSLSQPFQLTGQADRIDNLHNGEAAIIDYKSAGNFSKKGIQNATYPQLPLEALMLENGGFSEQNLPKQKVGYLGYWTIKGDNIGGNVTCVDEVTDITNVIQASHTGLNALVALFDKAETPYFAVPNLEKAPRFNDYAHLERIKEWAVTDDSSEEAA